MASTDGNNTKIDSSSGNNPNEEEPTEADSELISTFDKGIKNDQGSDD